MAKTILHHTKTLINAERRYYEEHYRDASLFDPSRGDKPPRYPLNYRCVWVTGMPRSGSTWVYNVVRELLKQRCTVTPQTVPQFEHTMQNIAKDVIAAGPRDVVAVVKLHKRIQANKQHSRFIATYRDPRDAMVSYMRFMKSKVLFSMGVLQNMVDVTDYYREFPVDYIMHVDYHNVTDNSLATVASMAAFLGLDLADDIIKQVDDRFKKQKVSARIEERQESLNIKLLQGQEVSSREVLNVTELEKGKHKNARAYDEETGFQAGHVSNYQPGEWRKLFAAEQHEQMNREFAAWFQDHGYTL